MVHGDGSWWWFMVMVHGDGSWWWFMVMVHGDDSWWWLSVHKHVGKSATSKTPAWWQHLADTPMEETTAISVSSSLLTVGGLHNSTASTAIHLYHCNPFFIGEVKFVLSTIFKSHGFSIFFNSTGSSSLLSCDSCIYRGYINGDSTFLFSLFYY